jgi:hypothetical protein
VAATGDEEPGADVEAVSGGWVEPC